MRCENKKCVAEMRHLAEAAYSWWGPQPPPNTLISILFALFPLLELQRQQTSVLASKSLFAVEEKAAVVFLFTWMNKL
jgi:hypothetical protein